MSNRNLRDPKFESGLLVVGKDVPRTDAHTESHRRLAVCRRPAHARHVVCGRAAQPACQRPHPVDRHQCRRAMPGVKAVVTGDDTAKRKWGAFRPDLYPLAIGRVRYVGDEVAR